LAAAGEKPLASAAGVAQREVDLDVVLPLLDVVLGRRFAAVFDTS